MGSNDMKSALELIYIAGEVRSGTTVVDLFFSDQIQAHSLGELANLEDYIDRKDIGWSSDWKCSCGIHLNSCSFWKKIIFEFNRIKCCKRIETKVCKYNSSEHNIEIANNCWNIIEIIANVYNHSHIIDSSKRAIQLDFLCKTKNKNKVKVIFVVRDSRAVSFSKANWSLKFYPNKKVSYFRSMIRWLITNISLANIMVRNNNIDYIIIKYEDFASNPSGMLNIVCKKLNIKLGTAQNHVVNVQGKHTIAGTPNKSTFNNTLITLDKRWKNHINLHKNLILFVFGFFCNFIFDGYIYLKRLKVAKITNLY